MPTIYSTENGQVVKASDLLGVYYYVADSLGTPTEGAWLEEEHAIAYLDGDESAPAPILEMDEQGWRLVECGSCGRQVRALDSAPAADDDEAWDAEAERHEEDCEWIETRAHQLAPARIEPIKAGYVLTDDGTILVQVPDPESRWGFKIHDDDRTWDGGFGLAGWISLADDDPRITDADRARLGWILQGD
jgi:hypothetical protein